MTCKRAEEASGCMCVIRRPAGSQNQSLSPEVESFSWWAPMSIQRLMSAADETLLRNEQQTDFYHFFPSVMNLPVDLWRSESLSEPKSGTACSLCLCVSVSVCSSSCAAGFCLYVTFQQPGPSCHDFVSLLGGFFFFSALVFFCRLSQPERQRNKSETPTKTKCWSLSQQLHTAHSCYANFRNHCFTPSLWIHIYTFFSYSSLSRSLSCSLPKQTTNNFFHALSSTAAS